MSFKQDKINELGDRLVLMIERHPEFFTAYSSDEALHGTDGYLHLRPKWASCHHRCIQTQPFYKGPYPTANVYVGNDTLCLSSETSLRLRRACKQWILKQRGQEKMSMKKVEELAVMGYSDRFFSGMDEYLKTADPHVLLSESELTGLMCSYELIPCLIGKRWKVKQEFTIMTRFGKEVTIYAGFEHDRYTMAPNLHDETPAIVHDFLYIYQKFSDGTECTRTQADTIFRDVMLEAQVRLWVANLYYSGVRSFGIFGWTRNKWFPRKQYMDALPSGYPVPGEGVYA